jgi:hypothetical protein
VVEGSTGSAGAFVGSSIGSMKMVRRGSPMFMLEASFTAASQCAVILPIPSTAQRAHPPHEFLPIASPAQGPSCTSSLLRHGHSRDEAAPGARAARRAGCLRQLAQIRLSSRTRSASDTCTLPGSLALGPGGARPSMETSPPFGDARHEGSAP